MRTLQKFVNFVGGGAVAVVVVAVAVAVAVDFDFDFRGPHLKQPENLLKNGSESNFV